MHSLKFRRRVGDLTTFSTVKKCFTEFAVLIPLEAEFRGHISLVQPWAVKMPT